MTYFREVSDLLYQSQTPNRNSSYDYARVKNLFRRAKIRDDFFQTVTTFTKYKIIGEERPEQVAEKIYGSPEYDWVVLISNNILNVRTEWPLSDSEFSDYLLRKYTETELTSTHHYETTLVRDSKGKMIIPPGKVVDSNFTVSYLDNSIPQDYSGQTTFVSTTHNNLPVRGYLYYPTTESLGSKLDVIVLFHGTITGSNVTPFDSAQKFLDIVLDPTKVNIKDKIIFSVAYPQDVIPAWNSNPALPAQQFPGIDYPNFYFGDNLEYVEAALLWVKNNLNSYFAGQGISKSIDKIFTFGHSQGASLVHQLNTLYPVDGVISNAPGPIDLLNRCSGAQQTINATCKKIGIGLGTTLTNPDAYNSVSLISYLSGTLSPTLFTQALDDDEYQVSQMKNVFEPGLNTCTNCNSIEFNYYTFGGHDAFVYNQYLQQDIRTFVGSQSNLGRVITVNPTKIVTVHEYEIQQNDNKRNIYILRPRYLQTAIDDMKRIMSYGFSSQYIDDNTKKGENLRVLSPR